MHSEKCTSFALYQGYLWGILEKKSIMWEKNQKKLVKRTWSAPIDPTLAPLPALVVFGLENVVRKTFITKKKHTRTNTSKMEK